jgi:UDP-glucuronate 4-epimerase
VRILVTGTAGFIGFHLARRLLADGHRVVGIDGLTPYYDIALKRERHAILLRESGFTEELMFLDDLAGLERVWSQVDFDAVIHLAAQAGVRHSVEFPRPYVDANLVGTFNLMELVRRRPVRHLMIASSSSVYGSNSNTPFVESDSADQPLTLYAATKRATELMAHSYSHLWDIPTTALRFFSVYGPWGRPDNAIFKFTRGVVEGTPIDIFNYGAMERDFTYIDDLIEATERLLHRTPPLPNGRAATAPQDSLSPAAPFRIVNIGCGRPVGLMAFLSEIEKSAGRKAICNLLPSSQGEACSTFANIDLLESLTGYRPTTSVDVGVSAFVKWYKDYHRK